MPNLSARLATLEQSHMHSGSRPAGMNDEQFVLHWTRMPPRQRQIFLRAMTDDDLAASVAFLKTVVNSADNEEHHHGKS